MIIRLEQTGDINDIREVNEKAFGRPQEANIVNRLRGNCDEVLSLVGGEKEKTVGHIFLRPVTIKGKHGIDRGMGLVPMDALPEFQRQGIGSHLVNAGIEELRKSQMSIYHRARTSRLLSGIRL